MIKNQRGSALLVVAGLIVVLSVIVDAVMVNYDSNMKSLESFSRKRQAFYMAEGVRALATVLIEDFLMTNPADDAALKNHLDTQLPALMPAPFSVSPVTVRIIKTTPSSTISSGPFKGMNGPITDVSLSFNVMAPSSVFSGDLVEPLELRLSVGYISMFQFMAFFDINQYVLSTGPEMEMLGRLHANGDFCVGGSGGFQNFLKVTVGGRLMSNADGRCAGGGGGTSRTRIATNPTSFAGALELQNAYDNGCANCNGSGLNWEAFALARWREQAQDTAHGVQILKLPGAGSGQVQLREAGNFAVLNNTDNLRFIVDPVIPSDSASVRTYKYAYNADIRILNGVWYIKNPLDLTDWPGLPIWSDHPGRFIETVNGVAIAVGQEDIRDRWAATRPWPASPVTPGGYSYYEYDSNEQTLPDTAANEGVISYGNLINVGGATPQRPGHWVTGGPSSLCDGGENLSCTGGCGFVNVQQILTCTPAAGVSTTLPLATKLLNATRGGIRNGHINNRIPGYANQVTRSRILPINFDVAQFQNAIANNGPGELGSYFGVAGFIGAPFNGVVYISSMWPGANTGYGTGGPQEHPHHGAINMPNPVAQGQAAIAHVNTQQALPQPLCSRLGGGPGEFAGRDFDRHGGPPTRARFVVPDCARYIGNPAPYPNALRVVNGANLNGARLPRGLSIVSNIPVYLMGDFNTNSNVSSSTATPWVSSLVGGDKVILISNAWNDSRSPWNGVPSNFPARVASNTRYNVALLTEPSSTLTSLLEDWGGRDLTVNGSMVYGYNAVYALHENTCCGNTTYDPPDRNFNFDPHFGLITNQPPGTPVFPVSAVSMWLKPQ